MNHLVTSAARGGRWPAHFEILDGLRGLAALGVVLAHVGLADIGHEAVMMFFAISGYCVTASARTCQRSGIPFSVFLQRRVRRIFPPYLAAVAFYVATRVVKIVTGGPNDLDRPWIHWLQNLTLTQWLAVPFDPIHWPADNPTLFVTAFWSLNYEMQFYVIIGLGMLVAARLGVALAWQIALLAGLGLVWNFVFPDGWITGLFIEYVAHFSLGGALYFVLCESRHALAPHALTATMAFLGVVCGAGMMLAAARGLSAPRAYEEFLVLAAFIAALVLLRPASTAIARHPLWQPIAALGTISYSLYLIHQFNLAMTAAAAEAIGLSDAARAMVSVALMLMIAVAFWFLFERPWLNCAPPTAARSVR